MNQAENDLDQEICLCFHVSRRKIEQFIRLENPKRVGQLAECFGAGTGCGWCRPWLTRLFETARENAARENSAAEADTIAPLIPSAQEYAEQRRQYRASGEAENSDDPPSPNPQP